MDSKLFDICPNCAGEGTVQAVNTTETRTVNKEAFEVPVTYFACQRCGESFQTMEMDDSLAVARDLYRDKHDMVRPAQLTAWRKSLGLSQVELAALLGWGVATVSRYENGKLQSEAHDKAMRMAMRSPDTLLELTRNASTLTAMVRERLQRELQARAGAAGLERAFLAGCRSAPGEHIDLPKLAQLVLLLSDRDGVFVTKLNKLLFYSDFKVYKERRRSLSGLSYERLPFGPVPSNFRLLFSLLEQRGDIRQVDVRVGNAEGTQVMALRAADLNGFDEEELTAVLAIKKRFGRMSATEISEASHQEQAWIETPTGATISYEHAASLSV